MTTLSTINADFASALPGDSALPTVPIADTVTRWASRLLGYASLAAACVGVATLVL